MEIISKPEQVWSISSRLVPIIEEPDDRLRVVCEPLTLTEIGNIISENPLHLWDMLTTMSQAGGIGLAAPQVGIPKRYFVLASNVCPIMFNPEIISKEGEQYEQEGCLSLPGCFAKKKRAKDIVVRYTDITGQQVTIGATGLMSVCIQHEYDHLDGILFTDGLSQLKKDLMYKKAKKRTK